MKKLSTLALLMLFAPAALAESSAPEAARPENERVAALVKTELTDKLAVKERDQSKFSRARMPAQERRVRLLDEQPGVDARGEAFYTFAVDARHGFRPPGDNDGWRTATVTGCVYPASGEVFVKVGERHRPAAFLLGKNLKPAAEEICAAAPAHAANAL